MLSPQRIARVTAIALTAGAVAAPVASAYPPRDVSGQPVAASRNGVAQAPQKAATYTRQDKQLVVPGSQSQVPINAVPPSAPAATPSEGFDWGDAGIGAAGGLVISVVGIGGALALSQRRTRRTTATAAAAS
jgi:hypothetical protein